MHLCAGRCAPIFAQRCIALAAPERGVRPQMKILAIIASAIVLLIYVPLMHGNPTWGLFHPRGGMVMLAVSLIIANVAIWLSTQIDRPLSTRFQLAAAGWIWLAVQGGCIVYLHSAEA